jgi:hypothetical protein
MKLVIKAIAIAATCCLFAGPANAQGLRQPGALRPAGYDTFDYYAAIQPEMQPSPSDRPPMPAPCGCESACDSGCNSCCDEPWTLFSPTCRGWTFGGWIEAGATANANDPASNFNGPVSFNDREEVQLNQLYFIAEKKLDMECNCWDIGGRIDFLWGTDGRFLEVPGLELTPAGDPDWNTERFYRATLPQIYAEVGVGDVSVKVGRFYTIIGYEVVPATGNFFYSHSYQMLYAEPFTHTGALATWSQNDRFTWYAGIVNGWDKFDGELDVFGFLGGVSYKPYHERYTMTLALVSTEEPNGVGGISPRHMYSFVFDFDINDCWKYVFHHDYGWQSDAVDPGVAAEWYGMSHYLFYTINDCWKAGARLEWFRDDDGVRVAGNTSSGNPADGG